MMRAPRWWWGALAPVVVACGDKAEDDTAAGGTGDGAGEDDGGDDGGTDDGGTDDGGTDDGGGDDGTVDDPCEPGSQSPTTVSETQRSGTYPTPAGGTPTDGVYDLARFEVYSPATADGHVRARRMVVSGDTVSIVQVDDGAAPEQIGGTFTVSGTNLVVTLACPQVTEVSVPFSATSDEIWLFDPSEPNLQVYVRD